MTAVELLAQPSNCYMNAAQQAFFHALLRAQRRELQAQIDAEFRQLREQDLSSDANDLGSAEEQRQRQLRLLERQKKLLDKIDQALQRLARGEYGWCAQSGEAIGLRRLLLRPTASLGIDAKQRQEQREKHLRES
ncbi:RNA polymerase-binding protein DksA [Pseudomonas cavernae]|uniref:RNA polymerase-binding protein DksA n=1 Tax=Pseudomonas cavernae TaxID=2320867 RepID=A0A385Z9N0_9PSED|nr:TraR/DksA C4-type zinc finger protein [Pseudomonas cavernae]AYC34957.1 RNA polymerase-binding protein DksA [Pseudomonas cavernae]